MKKKIIKLIARRFLLKEVFIGKYVDNIIAIEKFVASRDIIVQKKFFMDFDTTINQIIDVKEAGSGIKELLRDAQREMIKRNLRKEKKAILFYVEDNLITRLLGYKETYDHFMLKPSEKKDKFLQSLIK